MVIDVIGRGADRTRSSTGATLLRVLGAVTVTALSVVLGVRERGVDRARSSIGAALPRGSKVSTGAGIGITQPVALGVVEYSIEMA